MLLEVRVVGRLSLELLWGGSPFLVWFLHNQDRSEFPMNHAKLESERGVPLVSEALLCIPGSQCGLCSFHQRPPALAVSAQA